MGEVVPTLSFEEKLKEKVRESIGNLMSDEDIKKITERCIEDIFFKPIRVSNGYRDEYEPSPMQQVIRELLEGRVKIAVEKYLAENTEKIEGVIDRYVEELTTLGVVKVLHKITAEPVQDMVAAIGSNLVELKNKFNIY